MICAIHITRLTPKVSFLLHSKVKGHSLQTTSSLCNVITRKLEQGLTQEKVDFTSKEFCDFDDTKIYKCFYPLSYL